MTKSGRNLKLAILHQRAAKLGLDEAGYRAKLELLTGHTSAKDCSDDELDRALNSFHVKQSAHPHHAKIKALWIAAYNLGALDRGDDATLDAFVQRQTGKQRLVFVAPGDAGKVVEALKVILARHGFVPPSGDQGGIAARHELLRVQWATLAKLGEVKIADDNALASYVSRKYLSFHGSLDHLSRDQLDACARSFGVWIRRAKSAKGALS